MSLFFNFRKCCASEKLALILALLQFKHPLLDFVCPFLPRFFCLLETPDDSVSNERGVGKALGAAETPFDEARVSEELSERSDINPEFEVVILKKDPVSSKMLLNLT